MDSPVSPLPTPPEPPLLRGYFLRRSGEAFWREVTKEQFIAAERAAGFRSKFGADELATASFSSGNTEGKTWAKASELAHDIPSKDVMEVADQIVSLCSSLPDPRYEIAKILMERDAFARTALTEAVTATIRGAEGSLKRALGGLG